MPMSSGDVLRVSCRFKNSISGDIMNVYHWVAAGAISDSNEDIMDAVEAAIDDMYGALSLHLMQEQDPYDIRFDIVDWIAGREQVVGVFGTRTWILTNPPTNSQDGLPQMNAAIVNARSQTPQSFGRKYLGALSEGNIANGSLTGTVLTAIANYITYWLTDITLTGGDLQAAILSYKENGAGQHWWVLLSAVANAVIGTQRRRRISRGS